MDRRVASFRLRCEQIVNAIHERDFNASLYRPEADPPDVLILSKRYDKQSLEVAFALKQRYGTQIVLDLCDNHFFFSAGTAQNLTTRANTLRTACTDADHVIVASDALAEVVQQEANHSRITVIADAAEPVTTSSWQQRLRHPMAALQLARLASSLRRCAYSRRLVWFGNHGSPGVDGGMRDLSSLATQLSAAHRLEPIHITVISNNSATFNEISADWPTPISYLPWHADTFSDALKLHSAAIIPIGANPFTRCKTANRMLTAGLHGLNVIADTIPSYQPFAHCSVLNDWDRGLGPYLNDAEQRHTDVQELVALAKRDYSINRITERWIAALSALSHPSTAT